MSGLKRTGHARRPEISQEKFVDLLTKPHKMEKHKIPVQSFIPTSEKKLYGLEKKLKDAFKNAAKELGRIHEHKPADYDTHTIPQALYDFFDNFEHGAVEAAYLAHCERVKREGKSAE